MKTKMWMAGWVRLVVMAAVTMGAAGQVFGSIFADVVQPVAGDPPYYVQGSLGWWYNSWMLPAPASIGTVGDGQQIAIPYGKSVVVAFPGDYRAVDGTTYGTDIKVHCSGTSYAHMHIYVSSAEAPINESNRTWWAGGDGAWAGLYEMDVSDYPAFTAPVKYVRIFALGGSTDIVYLDAVEALNYIPTNAAPVAADDLAATEAGVPVTIAVLGNDHDDDIGDLLSVTSVGVPTNGSAAVNADNTVTYTPNAGFVGADEFSYTISDGNGGTCTAKVFVGVSARNVLIDIKPGSYPNSINLGSNGVVPVAILSELDFDATTVDPATVSLAGANVAVRGKGSRPLASIQDVNADGLLDLVLHVETENLDPLLLQDGYAGIVGTTYDSAPIIGADEITIVPQ